MKQLRGTPLKRFWREWRRANPVTYDLVLVLQSVSYPVNVGSLFRVADGAGVSQMILCSATPTPPHPTIKKVGRDRDADVQWYYEARPEDAIHKLRADGYGIYALEISDSATPYFAVEYPGKTCLVVGNEDHGVSQSVLALCDGAIFIPMHGHGKSLNVHVSAAIVLYHILDSRH